MFTVFICVYNLNMENVLFLATLGVVFFTLTVLAGGFIAYVYDCYESSSKPRLTWSSHHAPRWSKSGEVVARHENCRTCEITVVTAGGSLVGHSSME